MADGGSLSDTRNRRRGDRARTDLSNLPALLGDLDVLGRVVLGSLGGRDETGLAVLASADLLLDVSGLVLSRGGGRLLGAWEARPTGRERGVDASGR